MPKLSDLIKLPDGRDPTYLSERLPTPDNHDQPTNHNSRLNTPSNSEPSSNNSVQQLPTTRGPELHSRREGIPNNSGSIFDKHTATGNFLGNNELYQDLRTETIKWVNRLTNLQTLNTLYGEYKNTNIVHLPKGAAESIFRKELPGILGPGLGDYIKEIDVVNNKYKHPSAPGEAKTIEEYLYALVSEYIKKDINGKSTQKLNSQSNPSISIASKGTDYLRKSNPNSLEEHADAAKMFSKIDGDIKSNGRETYLSLDASENTVKSIGEIFKYFPFKGYKNLLGLSLDSTHCWDIKLEPFIAEYPDSHGNSVSYKFDGIAPSSAYSPFLPDVTLSSGVHFNYNDWMPIISYKYEEGSLRGRQIDLFGESNITVPIEFTSAGELTITILDDDNKSISNFMSEYINLIYDPKTHAVADYKDVCYVLTLYLYRGDRKITNICELVVMPTTYTSSYEGSEEATATTIDITFKVVGQLSTNKFKASNNIKMTSIQTIVT